MAKEKAGRVTTWDDYQQYLLEGNANWRLKASCRDVSTEIFYSGLAEDISQAKACCANCPVRPKCLEYAVVFDERYGVWGGAERRDRRRLWRQVNALSAESQFDYIETLAERISQWEATPDAA